MMSRERSYWVYILASRIGGTLYIGVTNDLVRRVYEHRCDMIPGFTSEHAVHKLVYYDVADNPEAAIVREKQIKGGSRQKKVELINAMNPQWQDLYETL